MHGSHDLSQPLSARAIADLVLVCPGCYGATENLAMSECPDCDVHLLGRIPISGSHAAVASHPGYQPVLG